MMVNKAYKFRIYPNKEQEILINKTFGCSRFVFNHFLAKWNETYKETGKGLIYNSCSSQLTQLKKELTWLKEVDSIALQSSLKNLADAYSRFFKKQNDKPRFKSKKNPVQSYTTKHTNDNIAIDDNKIKLPKLGWFRFAKSREVEGRILNATIRRNPSGKYFVSLLVETEVQELPKTVVDIYKRLTVRINSYSSKYRFYIWRQVKLRDYRDFAKAMKNYPDTVSSAIFFVYTSEDYFKWLGGM